MIRSLLTRIVPFMFIVTMAGCTTTELTSVWVDEEYQGKIERVLIVGIDKEPHQRRVFEDTFATSLETGGTSAQASYRLDSLAEDPTAEDIVAVIPGQNVDGVLVVRVLGVDDQTVYHPPTVQMVPYSYYDRFGGYYRTVYDQVHQPGYYSSHTIVSLETNLYESTSRNLLWSAQSRSVDPKSVEAVATELANEVISEIRRAGLM